MIKYRIKVSATWSNREATHLKKYEIQKRFWFCWLNITHCVFETEEEALEILYMSRDIKVTFIKVEV